MMTLKANSLVFDCLHGGEPDKPLVLLLHGFPESHAMYTRLIQEIAETGYYAVAPNLRGYSSGARPQAREAYQLHHLTADVVAMADALGRDQFHLLGHDWGASLSWSVGATHPDRLLSLTALSVPHLQAFAEAVNHDPDQHRRSRYMRLFQWPLGLPELIIRRGDYARFRKVLRNHSPELIDAHLSVLRQPGALTAALNYYRANYANTKRAATERILADVSVPTLFVWGNQDFAVGPVAVAQGHQHVTGPYTFLEVDGGHWLLQSNYPDIRDALLSHLAANG